MLSMEYMQIEPASRFTAGSPASGSTSWTPSSSVGHEARSSAVTVSDEVEAKENEFVYETSSPLPRRDTFDSAGRHSSVSEDEVVGVTAEGELLFRRRDGASHARRENGSVLLPFRPTPHRSQGVRPTVASDDEGLSQTQRPLFADGQSSVGCVRLTADDIVFAQLSLRLRDQENDVYSDHVLEELRRLEEVRCAKHDEWMRTKLSNRFWDLRRI